MRSSTPTSAGANGRWAAILALVLTVQLLVPTTLVAAGPVPLLYRRQSAGETAVATDSTAASLASPALPTVASPSSTPADIWLPTRVQHLDSPAVDVDGDGTPDVSATFDLISVELAGGDRVSALQAKIVGAAAPNGTEVASGAKATPSARQSAAATRASRAGEVSSSTSARVPLSSARHATMPSAMSVPTTSRAATTSEASSSPSVARTQSIARSATLSIQMPLVTFGLPLEPTPSPTSTGVTILSSLSSSRSSVIESSSATAFPIVSSPSAAPQEPSTEASTRAGGSSSDASLASLTTVATLSRTSQVSESSTATATVTATAVPASVTTAPTRQATPTTVSASSPPSSSLERSAALATAAASELSSALASLSSSLRSLSSLAAQGLSSSTTVRAATATATATTSSPTATASAAGIDAGTSGVAGNDGVAASGSSAPGSMVTTTVVATATATATATVEVPASELPTATSEPTTAHAVSSATTQAFVDAASKTRAFSPRQLRARGLGSRFVRAAWAATPTKYFWAGGTTARDAPKAVTRRRRRVVVVDDLAKRGGAPGTLPLTPPRSRRAATVSDPLVARCNVPSSSASSASPMSTTSTSGGAKTTTSAAVSTTAVATTSTSASATSTSSAAQATSTAARTTTLLGGKLVVTSNNPNYGFEELRAELQSMMAWAGNPTALTASQQDETAAAILSGAARYYPELPTRAVARAMLSGINAESSFNPRAYSPGRLGSGASLGLLQVSPYGNAQQLPLFQAHARTTANTYSWDLEATTVVRGELLDWQTAQRLILGGLTSDDLYRPWINVHLAMWAQSNLARTASSDPWIFPQIASTSQQLHDALAASRGVETSGVASLRSRLAGLLRGGGLPRTLSTGFGSWVAGAAVNSNQSYAQAGDDVSAPYLANILRGASFLYGKTMTKSAWLDSFPLNAGLVDWR